MADKIGLHRISNPNSDTFAVSLHRKFIKGFFRRRRLILHVSSVHTTIRQLLIV
jgi:hypothetical protein